ncbi:MAG: peptidylprolyl isomerase [Bacteroidales bacterium]|jgi:FKBP-type peptidyl-prolyl cis-trans isomerase SlyD|nr:peptidylprolyl isomerase [Bacteroidales bacterium]
MKIEANRLVALTYCLRLDRPDGELVEEATADSPMTFLCGGGRLLPGLENRLLGLEQGSTFEIKVSAGYAFGPVKDELVYTLSKSMFIKDGALDGRLQVGAQIPMMVGEQPRYGTVVEIGDEHAVIDFNHPLAGKDLFFTGAILDVHIPNVAEIAQHSRSSCGCGHEHHSGEHGCGCGHEPHSGDCGGCHDCN